MRKQVKQLVEIMDAETMASIIVQIAKVLSMKIPEDPDSRFQRYFKDNIVAQSKSNAKLAAKYIVLDSVLHLK